MEFVRDHIEWLGGVALAAFFWLGNLFYRQDKRLNILEARQEMFQQQLEDSTSARRELIELVRATTETATRTEATVNQIDDRLARIEARD